MDLKELIISSLSRVRNSTLEKVKELSHAELRWQPATFANPVGFLLFHIFRAEDRFFHRLLSTTGEIWEREGWNRRWTLPNPHPGAPEIWHAQTGSLWTPEQVAS